MAPNVQQNKHTPTHLHSPGACEPEMRLTYSGISIKEETGWRKDGQKKNAIFRAFTLETMLLSDTCFVVLEGVRCS